MAKTIEAGDSINLGQIALESVTETGIIQGYVVNAETGDHIPNAAIYLDGEFALYSWVTDVGGYRIADIPYGFHTITVEANDYETTDFQIVVDQPIQSINLEMPPLPPAPPGEWSEGVEVQSVFVEPSVAYQGETVNIKVYIQYGIHNPDAYPVPATIFGTVKVNGQELKEEFNIDYRNPTLGFPYIATQVGIFTVIAQDKSAKFTVAEKPVGTYYWPWGGIRIPRCLGFVIPAGSHLFPDEDFVYPESLATGGFLVGYFTACPEGFSCFAHFSEDELRSGHPTKWDPPSASVTDFDYYIRKGIIPSGVDAIGIVVVPTSFSCPPYWDSKEELAQIIAQPLIEDISGIKKGDPGKEGFYTFDGCNCINDIPGFPANVDPVRGVTDWAKPIEWGRSGSTDWIYCPYCGKAIGHTAREYPYSSRQSLVIARKLLEHIESDHPDHPLTEPA